MEKFQEDIPEKDSGRDGALILINSTLRGIHIKNYGTYTVDGLFCV